VTVTNPAMATALSVAAGGRLYNVVVDTEKTGSLLLNKGKLASLTTFIPLNQVQASEIASVLSLYPPFAFFLNYFFVLFLKFHR
jgi:structural maintenance of chromosome 2